MCIRDRPQIEQVHVFYLAEVLGPELDPGPESLEARFYDEADIPWDDLAFRTVATTLQRYFEDRKRGTFGPHHYTDVYKRQVSGSTTLLPPPSTSSRSCRAARADSAGNCATSSSVTQACAVDARPRVFRAERSRVAGVKRCV